MRSPIDGVERAGETTILQVKPPFLPPWGMPHSHGLTCEGGNGPRQGAGGAPKETPCPPTTSVTPSHTILIAEASWLLLCLHCFLQRLHSLMFSLAIRLQD